MRHVVAHAHVIVRRGFDQIARERDLLEEVLVVLVVVAALELGREVAELESLRGEGGWWRLRRSDLGLHRAERRCSGLANLATIGQALLVHGSGRGAHLVPGCLDVIKGGTRADVGAADLGGVRERGAAANWHGEQSGSGERRARSDDGRLAIPDFCMCVWRVGIARAQSKAQELGLILVARLAHRAKATEAIDR